MRTILLILAGIAAFSGLMYFCYLDEKHRHETATYQSVGQLLDCDPIPVAFNELPKTKVETSKGVFIVWSAVSGMKGRTVTLSSDGYLYIDGNPRGNQVLGR